MKDACRVPVTVVRPMQVDTQSSPSAGLPSVSSGDEFNVCEMWQTCICSRCCIHLIFSLKLLRFVLYMWLSAAPIVPGKTCCILLNSF